MLYAQWDGKVRAATVPTPATCERMPFGPANATVSYDMAVAGDFDITLRTAASTGTMADGGTSLAASLSSVSPLEFARIGSKTNSVTVSGTAARLATWPGTSSCTAENAFQKAGTSPSPHSAVRGPCGATMWGVTISNEKRGARGFT